MTVPTSSSTAETVAVGAIATSQVTSTPAAGDRVRGRAGRRPRGVHDPVVWVCWLFLLNFVLQRISLPGIDIPLSVPAMLVWLAAGWKTGVLAIEPRRFWLWLVGAGTAALTVLPQALFLKSPYISPNSWAFWMVIWVPACFMFADRSRETYERALRAVVDIGVGLGALSAAFVLTQLAGLPYTDYLAESLPDNLLVHNFNTSYPFVYDSPLMKSNGWFALEPSFMSFTLGLCLIAGIITYARIWKVAVIGLGMTATVGGSGFFLVFVAVVAMVFTGQRRLLARYVIPGVVLALALLPTQMGESLVGRASEGRQSNSSTALRTFEPYLYLWPHWTESPWKVFFGGGAGSSREVIDGSGVNGLLVPTLGKMLYEYGLLAGLVLAAIFATCYVRTPEPALAFAVFASMLILQPPAQPLMMPAFLLTTLWAPAALGNRPAGTAPDAPRHSILFWRRPTAPPAESEGHAGRRGPSLGG